MAKGILTVQYLENLGLEKEIATQIFADRGKEIADSNAEKAELERKLAEATAALDNMTAEVNTLKQANASGEEWKNKFDQLQADVAERNRIAEEERAQRAKQETDRANFNKAVEACGKTVDSWTNEFTRDGYFAKFVEAVGKEENVSKSHKQVLHDLVKDDPTAFKGINIKLAGGTQKSTGTGEITKEEFSKMSYKQRLEIYNTNEELYKKLTN